jgi:hypothetical protein
VFVVARIGPGLAAVVTAVPAFVLAAVLGVVFVVLRSS